ncbi:hypothetical protein UFOVP347_36 [uncultured Caudovirales phage]|uniref:Uncharacterized protein n=1 Tax=uncultured Caudovirales phage TaxID=2100421 RepID=A0A6J5M3E6_9CAUD|nr:hypothetical protein UFOVP347_36 [uncultured Caudovirales phage]
MALQPGLTPSRELSVEGGSASPRPPRRAPIDDPNTGRLPGVQGQARAIREVGSGARPAQGDNEFTQLARGLAALNPTLQQYSQVADNAERIAQEEAASGRIGSMTFEEARTAMREGTITELNNPWFQAAFTRQFAERHALWRVDSLRQDIAQSFNPQNGNLDEFITSRVRQDLEEFGSNPHFAGVYNQIMDRGRSQLMQQQTQQRVQETREQVQDNFQALSLRAAEEGIAAGRSPQEIFTALRGQYQGNQQFLNMTLRQQDEGLMGVARALAARGELDLVRHMLTDDRGGVGPLGGGARAVVSAQIIELAERERNQLASRQNYEGIAGLQEQASLGRLDPAALERLRTSGAISDAQALALRRADASAREQAIAANTQSRIREHAQAITTSIETQDVGALTMGSGFREIRDARFHTVEDLREMARTGQDREPSGRISAETRRSQAVQAYLNVSEAEAVRNNETPEQRFDREYRVFSRSGEVNPVWAEQLTSGFRAASLEGFNPGGQPPEALIRGIALYQRMAASPGGSAFLASHITDRSAHDFYQGVMIAQTTLRQTPEAAIQSAMVAFRDPARADHPMVRRDRAALETEVSALGTSATMPRWFPFQRDTLNRSEVGRHIQTTADFLVRMGMGPTDALRVAGERARADFTAINGRQVLTAGASIPPNFQELVQRRLAAVATELNDGASGTEYSLVRLGDADGVWAVVDNRSGIPTGRNITSRDLAQAERERRAEAEQAVILEQHRRAGPSASQSRPGAVIGEEEIFRAPGPSIRRPGEATGNDRSRLQPTPPQQQNPVVPPRSGPGGSNITNRPVGSGITLPGLRPRPADAGPATTPVVPPPAGAATTQRDLLDRLNEARR